MTEYCDGIVWGLHGLDLICCILQKGHKGMHAGNGPFIAAWSEAESQATKRLAIRLRLISKEKP